MQSGYRLYRVRLSRSKSSRDAAFSRNGAHLLAVFAGGGLKAAL